MSNKTRTILLAVALAVLLSMPGSLVYADSGYKALTTPNVADNEWQELGTVVVDAERGGLEDGDTLLFRLSEKCKMYESTRTITGPVVAGNTITYTIAGNNNGQVRLVIPKKVGSRDNDLFNAAGNDPFLIKSDSQNQVAITLQNYTNEYGDNRFYVYFDKVYINADNNPVRVIFEAQPGSGWPQSSPVIGYNTYPDQPSDLNAIAVSDAQIDLTWKDRASNESGYKVFMKRGKESYRQIAELDANTSRYSATGLLPETYYSFQVQAYNANGNSVLSTPAGATTLKLTKLLFKPGLRSYTLDNKTFAMDAAPIIKDSRALLPVRYVAEALGATVSWDASQNRVLINQGSKLIQLWIGKNQAIADGAYAMIDPDNPNVTPLIVEPGRTMVPLRFVAEYLGCRVDWDPATQEIKISYSPRL